MQLVSPTVASLLAQAEAHEQAARAFRNAAAELEGGARATPPVETDALLAHTDWQAGPPNETEKQRLTRWRRWADVARSGQIEGATKRGRLWFARRSAVDAFLAGGQRPTPTADLDDFFHHRRSRR